MENGDVENVKLMIDYCDVNAGGYHNGEYKRPLLIAVKSIQEENDFFFQIAQMLLDCKDVDVNANVAKNENTYTILEYICKKEQKTVLGVELLLNDHRTNVNKGHKPPLYRALKNVEREEDYFYKVAQMLLCHKNIDSNVKLLSRMCTEKQNTFLSLNCF